MTDPIHHRILLAVSTSRYGKKLVAATMREARGYRDAGDTVSIDVLYIIESAELERVSAMVGDEGFLGIHTQNKIAETLGKEHHRVALRRIRQVEAAAKKAGIEVMVEEVSGSFVETVMSHAEAVDYDAIFLTRADRPFISRILFGSEVDRVARLVQKKDLGQVMIEDAD